MSTSWGITNYLSIYWLPRGKSEDRAGRLLLRAAECDGPVVDMFTRKVEKMLVLGKVEGGRSRRAPIDFL